MKFVEHLEQAEGM